MQSFKKPLMLLLAFSFSAMTLLAQNVKKVTTTTAVTKISPAAQTAKGVSAEDQAAIKALFAGVDESKYSLKFGGKAVSGKRAVGMKDLTQVKRVTNPAEAAGYIVLVVEGDNVVYVLAVGKKDLQSVLGQEKALKLNQIMSKYQR